MGQGHRESGAAGCELRRLFCRQRHGGTHPQDWALWPCHTASRPGHTCCFIAPSGCRARRSTPYESISVVSSRCCTPAAGATAAAEAVATPAVPPVVAPCAVSGGSTTAAAAELPRSSRRLSAAAVWCLPDSLWWLKEGAASRERPPPKAPPLPQGLSAPATALRVAPQIAACMQAMCDVLPNGACGGAWGCGEVARPEWEVCQQGASGPTKREKGLIGELRRPQTDEQGAQRAAEGPWERASFFRRLAETDAN